ncbi:Uncharacterized protein FWK35_00025911, partial [Aphis craccivora]
VPSNIKCDFHSDLTNSTPAVTSKKKNVSNIRNLNNEVNELCIKFSELQLQYDDEKNDFERIVKIATDNNILKRKSRSPEKYKRLKKKIKTKQVENHEKIQKIHSIVKVMCIKFSELRLKYEDEEKDDSDIERYVKKATDLNVGKSKLKRKSRSPEKNKRLKKKITIKPVENQEKIQKFHSIVKDPPRKIKRIDVIDLTLSGDEEQGSNYIIDLTLSDDEEQGYRPSYTINRNVTTKNHQERKDKEKNESGRGLAARDSAADGHRASRRGRDVTGANSRKRQDFGASCRCPLTHSLFRPSAILQPSLSRTGRRRRRTLSGRSSRINAATGTFDVGRRTNELLTFRRLLGAESMYCVINVHYHQQRHKGSRAVSKDEAFGNPRALRRRSPGLHAGYGAIINKRPVPESQAKVYVSSGANESQAMVHVATTAITNRKTNADGSGDYTTPPPINTNAEHKIARPTQADLRGSGTTDKKRHLAVARPTQSRLEQFERFWLHNLIVVRPIKGRLAQFQHIKTSTKKIPQVNKIQSTVKAHYKTLLFVTVVPQ